MKKWCRVVGACLAAAFLLAGCSEPGESDLMAQAKAAVAQGDRAAAQISLKNLLQLNADSAEARLMLGKLMLETGDPVSALVELNKARTLQLPASEVLPPLARTMLALGQAKQVVDEFAGKALTEPAAQAEMAVLIAAAQVTLGKVDQAEAALQPALSSEPLKSEVRVVQARIAAARGQVDPALALLDQAMAAAPKNPLAASIKGELLYRQKRDVAGALKAFEQALVADPAHVPAHTAIVTIHLEQNQADAARKQFEALKAARPLHPETAYLSVQMAFLSGDYKAARELATKLLRNLPDHPRLLQLSGMIDLELKDFKQAEAAFSKVLQLQPGAAGARRLLAQTYLRSGREDRGMAMLAPLVEGTSVDVEALSLMANAHMARGEVVKAEALYQRVARARPQDAAARTALALTQLARGQGDAAFQDLERIAAEPGNETVADMALISARMRRAEFDKAQAAIGRLQTKLPGNPLPAQLTGRVALQRGDKAAARAAFLEALKVEPTFFPAAASLSAMDAADGRYAEANGHMDALLKQNPAHVRARLALIELRARGGAPREAVIADLTQAVADLPTEPLLRVQLVNQHLAARDNTSALVVARDALAAMPDDGAVLEASGRAQLAAGDVQQAVATIKRLIVLQPRSMPAYLQLAGAYRRLGDNTQALQALRQAQLLEPGDREVQRVLVETAFAAKQPQQALEVAASLQRRQPDSPVGHVLEGDIEAVRKNWPAAIAAYKAALAKAQPSDKVAGMVHRTLVQAGRQAEADAFMAARQKNQPRDAEFVLYRADLALSRGDLPAAEGLYREVLALQPGNLAALNNSAWLLASRGAPGGVALAERAVALMPDNPSLLDTLALALGAEKKYDRGIDVARQALAIAPDAANLRLTLARLYVAAGQKDKARSELEALTQLGKDFSGQAAVGRLLKSLNS